MTERRNPTPLRHWRQRTLYQNTIGRVVCYLFNHPNDRGPLPNLSTRFSICESCGGYH